VISPFYGAVRLKYMIETILEAIGELIFPIIFVVLAFSGISAIGDIFGN